MTCGQAGTRGRRAGQLWLSTKEGINGSTDENSGMVINRSSTNSLRGASGGWLGVRWHRVPPAARRNDRSTQAAQKPQARPRSLKASPTHARRKRKHTGLLIGRQTLMNAYRRPPLSASAATASPSTALARKLQGKAVLSPRTQWWRHQAQAPTKPETSVFTGRPLCSCRRACTGRGRAAGRSCRCSRCARTADQAPVKHAVDPPPPQTHTNTHTATPTWQSAPRPPRWCCSLPAAASVSSGRACCCGWDGCTQGGARPPWL